MGWCSVCHITATPLATLISAEKDVKGPLNFVRWFLSTNHMGYWAHPGRAMGTFATRWRGNSALQWQEQCKLVLTEDGLE